MGSASGDQGEDLLGCVMATLLGQLDGEELEVTDLFGGHFTWWSSGSVSLPCLQYGPHRGSGAIGRTT